jgi:hypothetical protein
MRLSWIALLAASLTGYETAAAAPLAVIDNVSGQVSIQTAKGIRSANPGVPLSEGDRLAIGRGSVTVSYLSGSCRGKREIGAHTLVVISNSEGKCAKRVEGAKAQVTGPGSEFILPAVGVVAVGGGVAAGLALSGGGGSAPAIGPFLQVSP